MMNTGEKITYCNGFRHNGNPADIETIRPVFECRRAAALREWKQRQSASREFTDAQGEAV